MIEVEVADVCSAGKGYIEFDPKRLSTDRVLCAKGGKWVKATIEGDGNINKIRDVRVDCSGCVRARLFSKTLKMKI